MPAAKTLLHHSFELRNGQLLPIYLQGQDKIAIIGSNGCGKTSLMRSIFQELSVKLDCPLTYLPQNLTELHQNKMTAYDFLCQIAPPESVRSLLANLQLSREEIHYPIEELSGGQKVKVFLAHAALNHSQLLLLDEPTRHLSPSSQGSFKTILKTYPGAVLLISHDRSLLGELNWERIDLQAITNQK